MASANLELVQSMYAAWVRGDFGSSEWAHPGIEFVSVDGPTPGRWTGVAGMAEAWGDFLGAWDGFRLAAEGYRELDDHRVLALTRQIGRGKTSGLELAEMRAKGAALFHIREGQVTRLVYYWDRDQAFADLDLAPEAGPPQA